MALPPKFAGHRLLFAAPAAPRVQGVAPAVHTLEFFLDYCCPFSAKMYRTLYTALIPAIREDPILAPRVQFIFRQQIQPWHPTSTLMHESAVVVLQLRPDRFWDYSAALFNAQKAYFDIPAVGETRNQIYARLAKVAAGAADVDEEKVLDLLRVPDQPANENSLNVGNAATDDLKLLVKMGRLTGVHVSPTVIVDGVVQNDIGSSWTLEQWLEFLKKTVAQ